MSFLKNSLLVISLSICVIYIFFTRDYYKYCNYAKHIINEDREKEKNDLFINFCNDVFKDYSKHSILTFSFGIFYSDSPKINEREIIHFKNFLNDVNIYSLRTEFRILQIMHFVYYVLILYTVVVSLTRLLINLVYYFLDKLLVIIFLIMIVEGVVIIFLGLEIDLIKIIKFTINYVPFNLLGGLIYGVMEYFAKIFNNDDGVIPKIDY
jgi:hypothetical protein